MKIISRSILPMTAKHTRSSLDHQLAIPISFFAGILIGIPITYCIVFLPLLAQEGPSPETRPVFANDQRIRHPMETVETGPVPPGILPGTRSEAARHPAAFKPSKFLQIRREKSGLGFRELPAASNSELHFLPNPIVNPIESLSAKPSYVTEIYVTNLDVKGVTEQVENPVHFLNFEDMVDGIFWTAFSENLVPRGFDERDISAWKKFLNMTEVLKVEEGCGRMQNRLVTLAEGGKSCCRYRYNNDQIQGEIFSFYLGRHLGIKNLAPSALALVDPRTRRWSSAASQIALAQWSSERPVVLTQFIEKLQPAFVPRHFRVKDKRRLHPTIEDLGNLTRSELSELVQWSDLVIFDYLTANLDRVVNNMYNERWNAEMMKQPTHNLAKTPDGLLLFLDNESGLLHGYRLLEKYEHFHRAMLDGLCIFKKETIEAVDKLHQDNNIETVLKNAFFSSDPGMSDWLPFLPDRSIRTLKERIANVQQQVRTCKSRFRTEPAFLQNPITDR